MNYKPLFATATGFGGRSNWWLGLSQFEAVHSSLQKAMEQLNMERRTLETKGGNGVVLP